MLERESASCRAARRLLNAAVTVTPLSKARVYLTSNRRSLRVRVTGKGMVVCSAAMFCYFVANLPTTVHFSSLSDTVSSSFDTERQYPSGVVVRAGSSGALLS